MWRPGIGSLAHFTAGLFAGALAPLVPSATIALTLLFIFYQWLDWQSERGGKTETVEYTIGLLIGVITTVFVV